MIMLSCSMAIFAKSQMDKIAVVNIEQAILTTEAAKSQIKITDFVDLDELHSTSPSSPFFFGGGGAKILSQIKVKSWEKGWP